MAEFGSHQTKEISHGFGVRVTNITRYVHAPMETTRDKTQATAGLHYRKDKSMDGSGAVAGGLVSFQTSSTTIPQQ